MSLTEVHESTRKPARTLDSADPLPRDSGRMTPGGGWIRVCAVTDLEVERGRAALIGTEQVALFLTHEGRIFAVSNLDPYSGAHVISRGIVGTRQDAPTVASPMYKQVFDLRTGACLDTQGKEQRSLQVWHVTEQDGYVHVRERA